LVNISERAVISGRAYVMHTCAGGSVWRMLI